MFKSSESWSGHSPEIYEMQDYVFALNEAGSWHCQLWSFSFLCDFSPEYHSDHVMTSKGRTQKNIYVPLKCLDFSKLESTNKNPHYT